MSATDKAQTSRVPLHPADSARLSGLIEKQIWHMDGATTRPEIARRIFRENTDSVWNVKLEWKLRHRYGAEC